jgi:hypothetical protein
MPLALVLLLLAFLGLDAPLPDFDLADGVACLHAYPFRAFENEPVNETPEPEGWQADDQFDDDYLVEEVRVRTQAAPLPADAAALTTGRPRAGVRTFVPVLAPVEPPDCYQLARLTL